ncbi:nitroreductase [Liquorilactobacillus sucicola DSM 21376 = JCM 15457]|uniref:Nitroreductase n=1 Tax=Liquorilactobacillus sucicola DSM 21376 = JCM 15457 TaxID=1423806 RepID=A0A023CU41_9LACO|nr:NADPH-dependent oxidoreductase [Liquorilactobacillus sucicola]KRN05317.1 Nitroreductase [Liquorilactobacillus sucicola DSM 21376 = JCM 15457]GAJ25383.1 nitroreductase [Liquorilactobacillus sucicola DSM 21376 = JCM 15457]
MIKNQTTSKQVTHRTIRAFKKRSLSVAEFETIKEVARHTATSMFTQQCSIMHLTDEDKRKQVRQITGQDYVGTNGDLFIFVADLYRNQQIRKQLGKDDGRLHKADMFMQAVQDTVLSVQNVVNAVESLGLGAVILGSINNDPFRLLQTLELPKMTYPILGLQVGEPNQEPQLKPRLPSEFTFFENNYEREVDIEKLHDYDQIVQTYYDLRDTNRRIDSFTHQMSSEKLGLRKTKRDELLQAIQTQGLCLD